MLKRFITRYKHIIQGWYLMIKDDKQTRELSKERLAVCKLCPKRNRYLDQCTECGCFLPAKSRVIDADCPLGLW